MVKQCGGTVEQWLWNSGTVMVERCRWKNVVDQWNNDGGTMWWNSGTVLVEHS